MNTITFPGFGIELQMNPSVFGTPIRWYGLIIALGFLLAVVYGLKRAPKFDLTQDDIIDVLLIATPLAIIFARLYYVAFNFGEFKDNLVSIFYVWGGGIAIYGAVIGAVIAVLIFSRIRKRVSVADLLDIGALGLLIGQLIGRWGNFVNTEAYGRATDLPWRMGVFAQDLGGWTEVHPTFLYESLWNLIGFIALHIYTVKLRRKFKGEVFLLYLAWYGLGRMWIEGLRTDSLMMGPVRVSQLLALLSLAIALGILIYKYIMLKGVPRILSAADEATLSEIQAEVADDSEDSDEPMQEEDEVFDEEPKFTDVYGENEESGDQIQDTENNGENEK